MPQDEFTLFELVLIIRSAVAAAESVAARERALRK